MAALFNVAREGFECRRARITSLEVAPEERKANPSLLHFRNGCPPILGFGQFSKDGTNVMGFQGFSAPARVFP